MRVSFILGAGASIPAGLPDVRRFYTDFRDHLAADPFLAQALLPSLDALEASWTGNLGVALDDLERLYELLTELNGASTGRAIPLALPPPFPGRSRSIELLEWQLKKYVQERCLSVRSADIAYLKPLGQFVGLGKPLSIVSLNYDPCVEMMLEEIGLNFTDGTPADGSEVFASRLEFSPSCDVHLVKLHGSSTWYHTRFEDEPGWMRRARGTGQASVSRRLGFARTLTHEAMMIYPTLHKALTNGPFPVLSITAQRAIAASDLCLAIGYAFGDVHVRRLVLEAMSLNPVLRLVLVNPGPTSALAALHRDAGRALHSRIGVVSDTPDRFGRIEVALASDWLLARSEEWLRGADIVRPLEATRGKAGGSHTPIASSSAWRLKYPIDGGVSGVARSGDFLYVARPQRDEIGELDRKTGRIRAVTTGLESLRGLAFDPSAQRLYAVSNRYGSQVSKSRFSRGGIGRLWAIDPATGAKTPLTRIDRARTAAQLAANRRRVRQEGFWKFLVGGVRWPSALLLETPAVSLLFTEARAVMRLDLNAGSVAPAAQLSLPFNVVGLAWESLGNLLVADAGVHPRGFGRLMRADLVSQKVDVIAAGWSGIGSLAALPLSGVALLGLVGPWPRGAALAVDLRSGRQTRLWEGLNRPGHFIVSADETEVLLSTADGLVELDLA